MATQNKVVLITGSTSGIGLAIAQKFAQDGVNLVIHGLATTEILSNLTNDLQRLGAASVITDASDLSDPANIYQLFDKITAQHSGVDILINNAGIQHVAPISDFPDDKWQLIINLNLSAAFYTIKNTIAYMQQQQWGRIVNIASAHGLVASPFKSAYVAAKHGIVGLTKSVALEVAKQNITVNAICPGYVKTPLVLQQIKDTALSRKISEQEVIEQVILGAQATKKFVELDEIAALTYYLCSDTAQSITGAAIALDGGWTAQ